MVVGLVIYAQSLYELVVKKEEVDPFELMDTAESIYRSVKAIGINNTVIRYVDPEKGEVREKGTEISNEMRALAAFIVKLVYRWSDNTGRLEDHYGLPTFIDSILGDTALFKRNRSTASLACISVLDVINNFTK